MIADAVQYIVFILLESYHIKVFNCKLIAIRGKYMYVFDSVYSSNTIHINVGNKILQDEFIQTFLVKLIEDKLLNSSKIIFVTQYSHLNEETTLAPVTYLPLRPKDLALVPYFTSSYIGSFNMAFCYLSYFASSYVDNKGYDTSVKWSGWEEMANRIMANKSDTHNEEINTWLNALLHPPVEKNSFYVASIASLILTHLQVSTAIRNTEKLDVLLGGEVYSWLSTPEDLLFSVVTGFSINRSHISIYHDSVNILSLTKAIRGYSLNLLEQVTSQFINHIGEIISVKTAKIIKPNTVIGKVTIHDDEGFQTLYPISEDIIKIVIHGLAKVSFNLTSPFFLDNNIYEFMIRDILIIDTRILEKKNVMNFKAWYDRMVSQ